VRNVTDYCYFLYNTIPHNDCSTILVAIIAELNFHWLIVLRAASRFFPPSSSAAITGERRPYSVSIAGRHIHHFFCHHFEKPLVLIFVKGGKF
jgi:hypothetical protein